MNGLRIAARAIFLGDKHCRYLAAERISRWTYSKYKFSEFGRIYLDDDNFLKYYESFEGTKNYHSLDRKYALKELLKLSLNLEGDTAECGAYKGASSFLVCEAIKGKGKTHHIFDSFEGISSPMEDDGSHWSKGDLACSEDIIQENLKEFKNVEYHKGWIPTKFHEVADANFCFLHLDVDLLQPTIDSLDFFYHRMSHGGVILCDDYGINTCPGVKQAMDTFFSDKQESIVSLPTGQGLVITNS